jgi:hypothetical protein
MMKEMFDPEKIVFPDDITLDVAAAYIIHSELTGKLVENIRNDPKYAEILAKSKDKSIGVEVYHYKAPGDDEKDLCPGDMTIGEWKSFPGHHMVVSISNGGVKSKPKVPELVS